MASIHGSQGVEQLHDGWRFAALIGDMDGHTPTLKETQDLSPRLWRASQDLGYPISDIRQGTTYGQPRNTVLAFAHSARLILHEELVDISEQGITSPPREDDDQSQAQAFTESLYAVQKALVGKCALTVIGARMGSEQVFRKFRCLPDALFREMPDRRKEENRFWEHDVWHQAFKIAEFSPLPGWGEYAQQIIAPGLARGAQA